MKSGSKIETMKYTKHTKGRNRFIFVWFVYFVVNDFFAAKVEDPDWMLDPVEFKTAWHPIGI